jgi:hypothetical protein
VRQKADRRFGRLVRQRPAIEVHKLAAELVSVGHETHRSRVFSTKNPFSVGVYLVDGRAAGAWALVDRRIALDPFERLSGADQRAVEQEREALEAFHA